MDIKVNAISGAYIVSFKTHLVLPEPLDSSIDTSPIPHPGMTPSFVVQIFWPSRGLRLMNFDLSGQKWEDVPLSTMTPRFEGGIFSESAMPTNVDVHLNAKISSVVVFAADSSLFFPLDPCFCCFGP